MAPRGLLRRLWWYIVPWQAGCGAAVMAQLWKGSIVARSRRRHSERKSYPVSKDGDYRQTDTYLLGDVGTRKAMNRYVRELEMDPHQMYLLVRKSELDAVSEEDRKSAGFSGQAILIVVALAFTGSMSQAASLDVGTIVFQLVVMVAVIVLYFAGLLDPYKMACRQVNKLLKAYPEAPDFDAWVREHPKSAASQAPQSGKKKSGKKGKKRKK